MKELLSLMKQTNTKSLASDRHYLSLKDGLFLVSKDKENQPQALVKIKSIDPKNLALLYYQLPHKDNLELALAVLLKVFHTTYSLTSLKDIKDFCDFVKSDKKGYKRYKKCLLDLDVFYENLVEQRNSVILGKLENEAKLW